MAKTIYAPGTSGKGTRERAKAWVGKGFSPGWCLYWCLTEVFLVPGLGDYDHDGAADAEDYWKAALKRGKVVQTSDPKNIPAGVIIMWTGGSGDHGHAAYSLGNGEMISTDLETRGKVGRVAVDRARAKWGLKLVGYITVDANGFTLSRDVVEHSKPKKLPKPVKYVVRANGGLRGHRVPDAASPTVRIARDGGNLWAYAMNTGGGREWAVSKNGIHYAAEYLKKA